MSRKRKLPKAGDKTLSAEFLKEISGRVDRLDRLTITGGELSSGPAGTAIVIPPADPTGTMKLVEYNYLPAAWGGVGRHNTTPLSIELGNYIPDDTTDGPGEITQNSTVRRRRMYGRTCNQWRWEIGSRGNAYITNNINNTPNLTVFNPYDLPLVKGYAWVQPMDPTDPDNLNYIVVKPVSPNPWSAVHVVWSVISNSGRVFEHSPRLLNGTMYESSQLFPGASGNLQQTERFVFRHNGDLMLPYPGFYKITWGAEVLQTSGMNATLEGPGPSGSPAPVLFHTHLVDVNFSSYLQTELHLNREPGPVAMKYSNTDPRRLDINLPMQADGSHGAYTTLPMPSRGEKTIIIANNPLAEHGGAWTRISFACKAHFPQQINRYNPSHPDYTPDFNYMNLSLAWAIIEPVTNQAGIFGGGANTWPNGYNQFNYNSEEYPFQWWGGGPEPPSYNELTGEISS